MPKHSQLVKQHFDLKYYDYDNLIRKLIPRYAHLHQVVLDQLKFPKNKPLRVLDLGIGTGQTALEILQRFSEAHIDGVDISKQMLAQGKARLKQFENRVTYAHKDMAAFIPKHTYDACVAVLSIHHLHERQKQKLFKTVYKALKPGGVFVIGDLIRFPTQKETKQKELLWKRYIYHTLGAAEGQYWFDNYLEEDVPSSIPDQIKWLRIAGFKDSRRVWKHMNYAVMSAPK
jgi:tRNA (cmo5U34)-methyltransferase